jgi:hypothetical protein
MLVQTLLIASDQLLTGFTVGTTVWFFFIQSPFLFRLMGREKFVPIMMQMTRVWVRTMFYSVTVLLLVSRIIQELYSSLKHSIVVVAWLAILINYSVVVPKALKAGARSHDERKGDNTKDVKDFALKGGSKTQTKTLHQAVVLFVLIMTGALLAHLVDLTAVIIG